MSTFLRLLEKISIISIRIFQYWNRWWWWWWWWLRVDRNNNNNFDIFFSGISLDLKEHGCQAKICFETTTAAAVVVVVVAACYFVPNEAANVRMQEEWNEMRRNRTENASCELTEQVMCVCACVCEWVSLSLLLLLLARWLVGWLVEICFFFLSFRSKNVH